MENWAFPQAPLRDVTTGYSKWKGLVFIYCVHTVEKYTSRQSLEENDLLGAELHNIVNLEKIISNKT